MNFSTGNTNAFLKLVDFLGRKLISYHTILSTAILVVKELFGVSSCYNLNHSAKNFLKAPGRVKIPTMQLVKVTQNKNKILTHPVVKMTTNRKQTYNVFA